MGPGWGLSRWTVDTGQASGMWCGRGAGSPHQAHAQDHHGFQGSHTEALCCGPLGPPSHPPHLSLLPALGPSLSSPS